VQRDEPTPQFDLLVRTAGGQERWVNVMLLPFPPQGEAVVLIHLLRDVHEIKETKELATQIVTHLTQIMNLPAATQIAK
jgi:hypothetical protein